MLELTVSLTTCLSTQRQLETLGAQRAGLEDMLKEMKRKVSFIRDHNIIILSFILVTELKLENQHTSMCLLHAW